MTYSRLFPSTVLILFSAVLVGCGGDDTKLAPVSGVVQTLDGQPVENATVNFTPVTEETVAPTAYGMTDSEGRFTLQTTAGSKGAFIGENSVSITLTSGDASDDSGESVKNLIPPKYNTESEEKFKVPEEGTEEAVFKVEVLKP